MLQRRLIAFCTGLLFFLTTNAQVNMQTGSATFSLPMFSWQDNRSHLNTVVALNYNSGSGLKVSELASNVGQGWNLVAGGIITRMPLGEPDDQVANGSDPDDAEISRYPNGILNAYTSNPPEKGCPVGLTRYPIYRSKNQPYKQHNAVAVDKQLDYFSFQFNGKSGMFVVNPGLDGGCKMLSDSKMKITFQKDPNLQQQDIRTSITSFTIQDVDGLIYKFREHGLTKVLEAKFCDKYMSAAQDQPNFKSQGYYYQSAFDNPNFVNPWVVENWYLDEIEDPFTNRKITFHYGIDETITTMPGAELSYDSWHNYVIVTYKKSIEQIKLLTSIDCPDGHKVKLNYNKDRVDLVNDRALTSVDVTYTSLNRDNVSETRFLSRHLVNTSYFILNRFGTPTTTYEKKMARLCLRSVKKLGPDLKEDAPPYMFDYYMGSNPIEDFVPPPFCVSHDIWGFYNGFETDDFYGNDILPIASYSSLDFNQLRGLCYLRNGVSGAKLNPKANYAKNGLLKQIIYPTGGTLSFEYAQNTGVFMGGSTSNMIGGVHVSATRSTDGGYSNDCNNPVITQYNYVLENSTASSLWGAEMPDNTGEMTMNYSPEKKNYRWSIKKCQGGFHGCCYWVYQYPGIQSQPQFMSYNGFQKFLINAQPVLSYLSAVMTVVDIIIVATSTAGGPPGAIVALCVDIIASYLVVAMTCLSDPSKHGTSLSYYSFDMNGVSPLPMQFKRVEVVEGSGSSGKTAYEFTSQDQYPLWDQQNNNLNLAAKQRFAPWAYGLPKKITLYDADGITKIKETENEYAYHKTPIITFVSTITFNPFPVVGVSSQLLSSCKCNVKTISSQRSDDWNKPENYNLNTTSSDGNMGVEIYPLFAGRAELIKAIDRVYKKGDNTNSQFVETVADYKYASNYEVSSTKTVFSGGNVKEKFIKYSGEFSGGVFDVMKQYNMISVPVSAFDTVSDGFVSGFIGERVTEFTRLGNGDIKPLRILTQSTDRPIMAWTQYSGPSTTDYNKYEISQLFSYDASGNLISAKDEGGRSVTTIYDYNDKYIVASVINADAAVDKPAYTSFETPPLVGGSRGGWYLAGTASYDNNAVTGNVSLNLNGNSCSTSVSNASKTYTLSFWANNNNVAVSAGAILVKSSPLINGFTYYEYTVAAGTSSVTLSGNALIDELRLYPTSARMRTVTYDPLVGKTDECDENNRVIYYEYDNLARLRFVKDENKNIVKMYEYNNVLKQNGCPATYYNQQITQYFTKSNCGTNYIGNDFSWTIPANKYSSAVSQEDADAQAEMELMDKGQANADAQANNSSNCKLVYRNAGKSENFKTESCDDGYEGGTVTYTVPANTYSSTVQGEVEQMELDDIAANGQAYANDPAHRICTLDTEPEWQLVDGGQTECRNVNGEWHLFELAKDINPNSPTYNQTSMQDSGPNNDCIPTTVDFKAYIYTNMSFQASFTNVATNQVYYFALYPSNNGNVVQQFPKGTYNITITPLGGSVLYEWWLSGSSMYYQAGTNSLNMSGVYFGTNSAELQIAEY